jgi:transposase InsO family protein
MEKVEGVKKKRKKGRYGKRYGFEFKLRCVKLRLEEGLPISVLSKEVGASKDVIRRWAKAYQERGEAGLRNGVVPARSRRKLPGPVREKIVEIKKREPLLGVKRISHLLKRAFFLSASPETVRRTLRAESLIVPSKKKKPRHNITRPRFFERSRPNQMWQSDIFTFRLGGRYAYLIGFIDDYSRYVVGLELYRSQTVDQVLEVYRRAVGEYGVAKEVLTDRGRQYTTWRGSTRFERELRKERVRHIKSQAHHPMTLGKIERFWKTIYEEFLVRAQFGSFEEARERIRQWVQYYNHKRPHQGIGGLCPADRYFEIQAELRKTMEQGIADNVLEMALRGKPREPFYMVGRMEGQSVVLRAEKGKLRLMVDDEEGGGKQEMVYEVTAGEEKKDRFLGTIERERTDGKAREAEDGGQAARAEGFGSYGGREVPCGALSVDGETQTRGGVPGVGSGLEFTEPVAGSGDGGDAPGTAASGCGGQRGGVKPPSCGIVGAEEQRRGDEGIRSAFGQTSREPGGQGRGVEGGCSGEEKLTVLGEIGDGGKGTEAQEGIGRAEQKACPGAGVGDTPGTQWRLDGPGRGEASGGVAKDLLRVGGEVAQSHGPGIGESSFGKTAPAPGPGEGGPSGAGSRVGEEAGSGGEDS